MSRLPALAPSAHAVRSSLPTIAGSHQSLSVCLLTQALGREGEGFCKDNVG